MPKEFPYSLPFVNLKSWATDEGQARNAEFKKDVLLS